jgi:hypothetical protein
MKRAVETSDLRHEDRQVSIFSPRPREQHEVASNWDAAAAEAGWPHATHFAILQSPRRSDFGATNRMNTMKVRFPWSASRHHHCAASSRCASVIAPPSAPFASPPRHRPGQSRYCRGRQSMAILESGAIRPITALCCMGSSAARHDMKAR